MSMTRILVLIALATCFSGLLARLTARRAFIFQTAYYESVGTLLLTIGAVTAVLAALSAAMP